MITPMTKKLEAELLWSEEELTKKSKMKNEGAGLLILESGRWQWVFSTIYCSMYYMRTILFGLQLVQDARF